MMELWKLSYHILLKGLLGGGAAPRPGPGLHHA